MHLRNKIDIYHYDVDMGYGHGVTRNTVIVTITFEDGKFKSVAYPFTGTYSRREWDALRDIYDQILELEAEYHKGA